MEVEVIHWLNEGKYELPAESGGLPFADQVKRVEDMVVQPLLHGCYSYLANCCVGRVKVFDMEY